MVDALEPGEGNQTGLKWQRQLWGRGAQARLECDARTVDGVERAKHLKLGAEEREETTRRRQTKATADDVDWPGQAGLPIGSHKHRLKSGVKLHTIFVVGGANPRDIEATAPARPVTMS